MAHLVILDPAVSRVPDSGIGCHPEHPRVHVSDYVSSLFHTMTVTSFLREAACYRVASGGAESRTSVHPD